MRKWRACEWSPCAHRISPDRRCRVRADIVIRERSCSGSRSNIPAGATISSAMSVTDKGFRRRRTPMEDRPITHRRLGLGAHLHTQPRDPERMKISFGKRSGSAAVLILTAGGGETSCTVKAMAALTASGNLERVKGIEPSYSAWKAAALPLSYTRAPRLMPRFERAVKRRRAQATSRANRWSKAASSALRGSTATSSVQKAVTVPRVAASGTVLAGDSLSTIRRIFAPR